jgi:hypothetical protein
MNEKRRAIPVFAQTGIEVEKLRAGMLSQTALNKSQSIL